jgi:hypothetical protein
MFSIKGDFRLNENWLSKSLDEWLPVLRSSLITHWGREQDPETLRPWAPLTPKYRAWKIKHHGNLPKLILSGKMLWTTRFGRVGNRITVDMPHYGIFHQKGTPRMKARPWLGVPNNSMKQLSRLSIKNILQGGKRNG